MFGTESPLSLVGKLEGFSDVIGRLVVVNADPRPDIRVIPADGRFGHGICEQWLPTKSGTAVARWRLTSGEMMAKTVDDKDGT